MELMVPIENKDSIPLYEQIYRYIKTEIRAGRLRAGSRLPSTRTLADNLHVSRSTTQLAYEQLLSEGYIEALPCRGYFVCQIEELVEVKYHGVPEEKEEKQEENENYNYKVDFSPRGIDLDSFPFNAWRKLSKNTLVDDNKDMFAVGNAQGEYSLRQVIRDYLHSARGVHCRPEQILVGAGSEYLLMLLSQLIGRSTGIALENPTYKQAFRVFESLGHPIFPVSMDEWGMKVKELEKTQARIAYVMPSHQYPTGIVIPIKRRQELLKWAKKQEGRYLIEDDYDSEFRYKGRPIPALQGMDDSQKVIYMGTFSRSIAPAIRVGFMVLPEPLLALYREKAGFYASTVSRVDQNILTHFIIEGYYERHLNRMRSVYRGKHDTLLAGLRELEPYFEIGGEYAGIHVLLTHKKGISEKKLTETAAQAAGTADVADKKVGISIYKFDDNFMTLYRTELVRYLTEDLGFKAENVVVQDGKGDQAEQTNQIQNFITQKYDVLILNLVQASSAPEITDMCKEAGIPVVYINREPDAAEEERWESEGLNATYVGCDARQSGTYQGEMIADLGLDTVDMNGNGKIDYIMIEGDPENVDAQYRTEYSIKALEDAGLEVNCLDDQVGMWDQATAQQLVANSLSQNGNDIEVVFCNNDAMALGALQAIESAGRTVGKDIYLVGVDALSEALEDVLAGTMTGTVFNDHFSQSHSAADAAINYLNGTGNEHYIGCDYVKVTKDNAQEILDMVK